MDQGLVIQENLKLKKREYQQFYFFLFWSFANDTRHKLRTESSSSFNSSIYLQMNFNSRFISHPRSDLIYSPRMLPSPDLTALNKSISRCWWFKHEWVGETKRICFIFLPLKSAKKYEDRNNFWEMSWYFSNHSFKPQP